jgi:hypothetical protein
MGSPAVAAWIAHVVFWVLLASSAIERRITLAVGFVVAWLAGRFALSWLAADAFFVPYVAILDIALVLLVYKGDIRLT